VSESDNRRPRSVYEVGEEPDPRVTLANERTALAWLRTALALVAGGIALVVLSDTIASWKSIAWLAIVVCLAGGLAAALSVVRWARVERAVRTRAPIPAPHLLAYVAAVVVLVAVVVSVAVAVRR